MQKLMTMAALLTLVSAPAFARSSAPYNAHFRHGYQPLSAYGAVTAFGSSMHESSWTERDAAIHGCNAAAAKTYPIRDSNWSILLYRACMTEHGQPE